MSWDALRRPAPQSVTIGGTEVRRGSRVRLRPRPGADVWDLALDGREAVVEGVEQDVDDERLVQLAVVLADDPGRDLLRRPGHRFFFTPDEVEPLAAPSARVLVAGIGNVFLGDDGFGVELAGRLARDTLPPGVEVVDYGIRGMDLAYALLDGWDAAVLLDAAPCGKEPGTLYVIEPDLELVEPAFDAHGMDPVTVLALARALGGTLPRTLVVGCEPLTRMTGDEPDVVAELSAPVRAALDAAVPLVGEVLAELVTTEVRPEGGRPS
jgi:hydrogenase maturation protease